MNPIGSVKAATAVIGDKWTPQLLRFFSAEQAVRFCELQDLVGGINPRTLSARLASLETSGVITKRACATAAHCEYVLTAKGSDLLPIIRQMEQWSRDHEA